MNTEQSIYFQMSETFVKDFDQWFDQTYPGFSIHSFKRLGFSFQVGVVLRFFDMNDVTVEVYTYEAGNNHKGDWRIQVGDTKPMGHDDLFRVANISPIELKLQLDSLDYNIKSGVGSNELSFKKRQQAMFVAVYYAIYKYHNGEGRKVAKSLDEKDLSTFDDDDIYDNLPF